MMSVRKTEMPYLYLNCIITTIHVYCYYRDEIMQTQLNQILIEVSANSLLFDMMSSHRYFQTFFKPLFKKMVNNVDPNGLALVGANSFGFKLIGIIMLADQPMIYWSLNRFYVKSCGHRDEGTAETLGVYAREYTYTCKYIMIHICLTSDCIFCFILIAYNYTSPCNDHVPCSDHGEVYSP